MARKLLGSAFLVLGLVAVATAVPITDAYNATLPMQGGMLTGGGTGYENGTWYEYPSGWWNEWFYNAPYDPERWKTIHVQGMKGSVNETAPFYLQVAVNYSSPEWSLNGNPPGTPRMPPLPGVPEDLYIVREPFEEDNWLPQAGVPFTFDMIIPDYNPEWVSIDVRGYNFWIDGIIIHECVPEPASLSLLVLGTLALMRLRRN